MSEPKICAYCCEDRDGYVLPLEKNGHAFIGYEPIDGWVIYLKDNRWRGKAKIRFCPMCGREFTVLHV